MNNEITTAQSNFASLAPAKAVELASARLPEMVAKTQSFGRSNSQTTTSLMSLTMLTGQAPHRQVRQVSRGDRQAPSGAVRSAGQLRRSYRERA